MCEQMTNLVARVAEYLRGSEGQLRCFHEYETQVEGWFKGELMYFLHREMPGHFWRERLVRVGDHRIIVDLLYCSRLRNTVFLNPKAPYVR